MQRVPLTSSLHIKMKKDRVGRRQAGDRQARPSVVGRPVAVLL